MPLASYTVAVTQKRTIAHHVIEFTCKKPANFAFTAGQFIMFDAPHGEDPTNIQPRAYSIASAPHEDELLFVVKLKDAGRFSTYLANTVEPGTTLRMQGPLGTFTLKDNTHDIVMVATGSGIAPFRSMIMDCAHRGDPRQITLLFGVRHREEWIWYHELRALAAMHPRLSLIFTLSGDQHGGTERHGRVTDHLASIVTHPSSIDLFVCGSPAMVKDVKTLATNVLAIPKAHVHGEGYI